MSYINNIAALARENLNFRKVLFTGAKSQLVAMRIPHEGEVGEETHEHVEQTLFILDGECRVILNGDESVVGSGAVIVISPGTRHNVINSGAYDLILYTVYAPANHIDGRVHPTKADADADKEDEDFGHSS